MAARDQFLPQADLDNLTRNIRHLSVPAQQYIDTPANVRDVLLLPPHIAVIELILEDLLSVELGVPPPVFNPLRIHLEHLQDGLRMVQDRLFEYAPDRPPALERTWVRTEAGGYELQLDEAELERLFDDDWSYPDMAEWFDVSLSKIKRALKKREWTRRDFDDIADDDLQSWIRRVWQMGSGIEGIQGVIAGLQQLDVHVQRDRVRAHLTAMAVDNPNVRGRYARTALRRVYRVPFVNSLWHMDGHHKLIRYKIVIHGCIDGLSRTITYLRAVDNNRAETVIEFFEAAISSHGVPSRVRGDYGGENLRVKDRMEDLRGTGRGSFIQGKSTRNQRIERLWVEVQRWCTQRYYTEFGWLEHYGHLSIDNPLDMYCLHYCFIPQLNGALDFFVRRWNGHGIQGAQMYSPRKMWSKSMMHASRLGINVVQSPRELQAIPDDHDHDMPRHRALDFAEYGVDNYGRRADGQPRDDEDDPYVVVPPVLEAVPEDLIRFILSPVVQVVLQRAVGPGPAFPAADDQGTGRYLRCRRALDRMIRPNFPQYLPPVPL